MLFIFASSVSIDLFPEADFILIDAPCTGTGIIGKKVDIRIGEIDDDDDDDFESEIEDEEDDLEEFYGSGGED